MYPDVITYPWTTLCANLDKTPRNSLGDEINEKQSLATNMPPCMYFKITQYKISKSFNPL